MNEFQRNVLLRLKKENFHFSMKYYYYLQGITLYYIILYYIRYNCIHLTPFQFKSKNLNFFCVFSFFCSMLFDCEKQQFSEKKKSMLFLNIGSYTLMVFILNSTFGLYSNSAMVIDCNGK